MKLHLLVVLFSTHLQQAVNESRTKIPSIVLYSFFAMLQLGDRPIVYKSLNMECTTEPRYAINSACRIKARNWNLAVAHMDVYLILPLRNVSVRYQ